MTKPQFASEPSMEDILASIRKMISDDRSGPRPLPDQMTRTPFPDATAPAETSGRWENRSGQLHLPCFRRTCLLRACDGERCHNARASGGG